MLAYICTQITTTKKLNKMEFTTQDFKMIEDLKAYGKAIKFEITNENDVKELLHRWVNHRVNLTPGQYDQMFNNYLTSKNIELC